MKIINFMDLGDGTNFRVKQADDSYIEYVKIPEERISSSAIHKQRGYKLQIENFSFVNEKVTQQLALQLVAV